jgi:MFS family permease
MIHAPDTTAPGRPVDFWLFWAGQAISALGSSLTAFALPLLVFKLTGSAINLALSMAASMLPYLCFGLIIGAWVDRADRRRLMIATDVGRAAVVALLPLLAWAGLLSVWWIYAVLFANSTLAICFDAAKFAAIPSLVPHDDLVAANGRLAASGSLASILGPLLAGVLVAVATLPTLLFGDALSFLVSAGSLALVRRSFNAGAATHERTTTVRQEIGTGLRYVWDHPVLRWLTPMSVLVNFVVATVIAQFVLFAKQVLSVSDAELAGLYAAGSIGVIVIGLAAGPLSRRWSFSVLGLGGLMLFGLLILALSLNRSYPLALLINALIAGMANLYNISAASLGQAIIPDHIRGRVVTFITSLSWSVIPVSVLIGGALIEWTGDVALIYGWLGALTFLVVLAFVWTPLGRVGRFTQAPAPAQPSPPASSVDKV